MNSSSPWLKTQICIQLSFTELLQQQHSTQLSITEFRVASRHIQREAWSILFYRCLYLRKMLWLFQICHSDDFDFGTLNTDGFCTESKSKSSASVCQCKNALDHIIIAYICFCTQLMNSFIYFILCYVTTGVVLFWLSETYCLYY